MPCSASASGSATPYAADRSLPNPASPAETCNPLMHRRPYRARQSVGQFYKSVDPGPSMQVNVCTESLRVVDVIKPIVRHPQQHRRPDVRISPVSHKF
ncbi:hypothetical protein A0H81_00711 [Grifola frondosa]|uniref:Uncharacterized protein n=1 Tax=Grifola frondosa TaxID=5627 RepID=A0A1C7MQS6_GRIFR|nr:hypothetical protein A0H81_00711 [Grifola frondosa]